MKWHLTFQLIPQEQLAWLQVEATKNNDKYLNGILIKYNEGDYPEIYTIKSLLQKVILGSYLMSLLTMKASNNKGFQPLIDKYFYHIPPPLETEEVSTINKNFEEIFHNYYDSDPLLATTFNITTNTFTIYTFFRSPAFTHMYLEVITVGR